MFDNVESGGPLIKTDGRGNTVWIQLFSMSPVSDRRVMRQTSDGGYIVGEDGSLLKTDSEGNMPEGLN